MQPTRFVSARLRWFHRAEAPGSLARTEARWGWVFLSPWLIGFLAFILLPTLATLGISFTDFSLQDVTEFNFVGFANYRRMLNDPLVAHSMGITLKFMAMALPIAIALPIALAALVNSDRLVFRRLFQTLFYMPYMVPLVSAVLVWGGFLNAQTGWLNKALGQVRISGPDWINSTFWIYPALLIVGLWANGNAMITTLAGMQSVPSELYDSAQIDGAGTVARFRHITLPLITPIIFYNLTLSLVGLFQYFLEPYVLTVHIGDPGNATLFYNMYLFQNFFRFQDMAYGATLAWVLFLIILTFTAALFATRRFWVFEAEQDRF